MPARRIRSIARGTIRASPSAGVGTSTRCRVVTAAAGRIRSMVCSCTSTKPMFHPNVDRLDADAVAEIGASLAAVAERTRAAGPWRSGAFAALARCGLLAGFVPADCGGTAASEPALTAALVAIAARCLTTALAVTQWAAAVRVIASADTAVRRRHLPRLAVGAECTTVGIAQLTTSRQHTGRPALGAVPEGAGWRLDGVCPWVTGADACDTVVVGASLRGGDRGFFLVERAAPGLEIDPPLEMLALSGSRTAPVRFHGVRPAAVLSLAGDPPRTGGLATTALALGAAQAAREILQHESLTRPALGPAVAGLDAEAATLHHDLLAAAAGGTDQARRDRLRAAATSLVLRASQAALTACKGAGFVAGHPAERLVREAHFFLVWSCPEAVSSAVMCELAGLE